MKSCLITIAALLLSLPVFTTSLNANPNSCYVELGGPTIIYSINYEHLFMDHVAARIGYSYLGGEPTFNCFPATVTYLAGSKKHRLESGAGCMYVAMTNFTEDQTFWLSGGESVLNGFSGNLYLGYRYQPVRNGFVFRVGFAPSFSWKFDYFLPWFGISFGYSF